MKLRIARYPLVVDWRCEDCGRTGTAVALVGDVISRRIAISHARQQRHACTNKSFQWEPRTLKEVRP